MVYFSFLMILVGMGIFTLSIVTLIFRLVKLGGWDREDFFTYQVIKVGGVGVGMTLLGQIIIWLVL